MGALEANRSPGAEDEFLAGLLRGHRFRFCSDAGSAADAIAIRRRVYVHGNGYDVPVPDAYDARSWHILAEDVELGTPCGSMRLTPRDAGPVEAEEYFQLPAALRQPGTVELSRFAILPAYRKSRTFLPVVSLGMFTLVRQMLDRIGVRRMVICSKPERLWTFEWLRFRRTGLRAGYDKLAGAEHELLCCEVREAAPTLADHPFRPFLEGRDFAEVERPAQVPALGLFGACETPDDRFTADGDAAAVA